MSYINERINQRNLDFSNNTHTSNHPFYSLIAPLNSKLYKQPKYNYVGHIPLHQNKHYHNGISEFDHNKPFHFIAKNIDKNVDIHKISILQSNDANLFMNHTRINKYKLN